MVAMARDEQVPRLLVQRRKHISDPICWQLAAFAAARLI